jgi:hypothetical protein
VKLALFVSAIAAAGLVTPAAAQLYIDRPPIETGVATGTEPGLMQALPGATPAELRAGMVWTLRSGLNFAALQCQFSKSLQTVGNYNDFLAQHRKELAAAYATLGGYFKRSIKGPASIAQFDQYTTRSVASFSTVYGQVSFCDTAAQIGREAIAVPKGGLTDFAVNRIISLRRSLTPVADRVFTPRLTSIQIDPVCPVDKKGRPRKNCR